MLKINGLLIRIDTIILKLKTCTNHEKLAITLKKCITFYFYKSTWRVPVFKSVELLKEIRTHQI